MAKASSQITLYQDIYSQWCHDQNKTLINGAKIYTGSITADKISVTDLYALGATIGGFKIGSTGIYNGTSSISSNVNGIYVGTDGIRTVGEDGENEIRNGHASFTRDSIASGKKDKTIVYPGGIGMYLYTNEEGEVYWTDISFHVDDELRYCLDSTGIYGSEGGTYHLYFDDPSYLMIGKPIKLVSNAQIGTDDFPSGTHTLANNKSVGFLNSEGTRIRGMGLNTENLLLIGQEVNSGAMRFYISDGYNVGFYAGESKEQCFASIVDSGLRYFQSKPIYNQTTSSGTAVRVNSNGTLFRYVSSSMRYKEEITCKINEDLNPERLYDLNVWQYKYRDGCISKNDQRYGMTHIGLLAEDVKHHYPIAANYNEDGYVEDWSERYLIPPMLKLIQNQHNEIELLKTEIHALHEQIDKLA